MKFPSGLLAIDLETTGLKRTSARIVEIAILTLDEALEAEAHYVTLVNPGMLIPADATDIHGIKDADVATAPLFASIAHRVQRALDAAPAYVGHNLEFDLDILDVELRRCKLPGVDPTKLRIDSLQLERKINSHRLGDLVKRYGINMGEGWHRAGHDALASTMILKAQLARHANDLPSSLEDMDARRMSWASNPRSKQASMVDASGRLYRTIKDGVVRFGFGQWMGAPVSTDYSYCEWLVRDGSFPRDTVAEVVKIHPSLGKYLQPTQAEATEAEAEA